MTKFIARLPRRHSPGITQNTRSSAPWRPASRPSQDAQIGGSGTPVHRRLMTERDRPVDPPC